MNDNYTYAQNIIGIPGHEVLFEMQNRINNYGLTGTISDHDFFSQFINLHTELTPGEYEKLKQLFLIDNKYAGVSERCDRLYFYYSRFTSVGVRDHLLRIIKACMYEFFVYSGYDDDAVAKIIKDSIEVKKLFKNDCVLVEEFREQAAEFLFWTFNTSISVESSLNRDYKDSIYSEILRKILLIYIFDSGLKIDQMKSLIDFAEENYNRLQKTGSKISAVVGAFYLTFNQFNSLINSIKPDELSTAFPDIASIKIFEPFNY